MSSTRSGNNQNVIYSSIIKFILNIPKYQKYKIHDFTEFVHGRDYVFEPLENYKKGYMTAQCRGIKRGDWIILRDDRYSYRYQVEEIDYYTEPPDMWIALLNQVIVDRHS